jgi:hypothetical protein
MIENFEDKILMNKCCFDGKAYKCCKGISKVIVPYDRYGTGIMSLDVRNVKKSMDYSVGLTYKNSADSEEFDFSFCPSCGQDISRMDILFTMD